MLDLRLPDYEVVVHIKSNTFSEKLEKEILLVTSAYDLEENTEYQGVKDYHWAFESWREAVQAGEELRRFVNNPNLLLLRVKANYDESITPITHKEPVQMK